MTNPARNTICLWYDGDAEDAARFYAETFPDSSVDAVHLAPGDYPSGKKGNVLTVEFTVLGIRASGSTAGPCSSTARRSRFRSRPPTRRRRIATGTRSSATAARRATCGWCKDRWGLSWQITPIALTKAVTDPDPAVAKRAFEAMQKMKKIDVAAIEAARRG